MVVKKFSDYRGVLWFENFLLLGVGGIFGHPHLPCKIVYKVQGLVASMEYLEVI